MTDLTFEDVAAVALHSLPSLVQTWFPAGTFRGREYLVGGLAGEAGESLSINTVTGRWSDFATGDKGGDAISLYAAAFCGKRQGDALNRLGAELGLTGEIPPERAQAIAEARDKARRIAADKFEPMPAPEPAPSRLLEPNNGVWIYRGARGEILQYVIRRDDPATGKKSITPLVYGRRQWIDKRGQERDETRWHHKHPLEPLPLYGLDRLAADPTAPVMLCEGEKAADAAQRMFPAHVCMTWPRGSSNAHLADWSPLAGRYVIIWPDNDEPGRKAAAVIEAALQGVALDVFTLRVDDLGPGEDAADIAPADPLAWLEAHSPGSEPPSEPAPELAELPPDYEPASPDPEPAPADGEPDGVIPLGYERGGRFFYYSKHTRQVFELKAGEHGRNQLCAMASGARYWQNIPHLQGDKGTKWPEAADWLMDRCRDVGIFDPDKIRGRGAWLDDGRVVVHLGDRLLVDGASSPLMVPGSRHIYEAARQLVDGLADPLPVREAHKLLDICKLIRWERGVSARLAAGWLVLAPICGALDWRPSVWITGGAGSGKTYFVNSVVLPAIGKFALHVKMPTTAAFISSYLNSDARPVVLDEAERESPRAAAMMQQIFELVRQGASADEGIMGRGTQTGGAIVRRVRSPFLFQSVNVTLEHAADASRVTVLSLGDPGGANAASVEQFRKLQTLVGATLTPEFSAGLIARSAMLLPVIRRNAVIFAEAIAERFGSRREGDQLGALLAGAYSLHSNKEITPDKAREIVSGEEWEASRTEADEERDEVRLLRHLLAHQIRTKSGDVPVSRLIEAALHPGGENSADLPAADFAERLLSEFGIKPHKHHGQPGIAVSTKAPPIAAALDGTPWASGWGRSLARLPGAVGSSALPAVRFAYGPVSRATWLPVGTIEGESPA